MISFYSIFQAKKKYDKDMARKEKAAKKGEGTWMLDSVSKRIAKEEKVIIQSSCSLVFIHEILLKLNINVQFQFGRWVIPWL